MGLFEVHRLVEAWPSLRSIQVRIIEYLAHCIICLCIYLESQRAVEESQTGRGCVAATRTCI